MIKKFLLIILLFSNLVLFAQQAEEQKEPWVKLGGYVRSDIFFDSRETVNGINGMFLYYPMPVVEMTDGNDMNANPSLTMLAVSSRLNTTFRAPDVLNAKVTGRLEFDFTVFANATSLRLRHAYGQFSWDKAEKYRKTDVLFGQTWHPAFVENCVPLVVGLSTGAPFQEFNRSPQIRVTQKLNRFELLSAFVSQMDYMSTGYAGASPQYLRNAIVPEFDVRVSYQSAHFLAGVNGSVKTLKPRNHTIGSEGTFKASETLTSFSVKGFAKYFTEKFAIKAAATYGGNLYDYLMPGGYGVASLDTLTGKETYTPLTGIYSWINVTYGKKWQGSLTAGYGKNLGSTKPLYNNELLWGRALNIDHLYRIIPSVFWNINRFQLALEYEMNTAAYGSLNLSDGKVLDTKGVTAHRIAFAATFFF